MGEMNEIFLAAISVHCALHSTRTQAMGEPPPVNLLSWSRGGLVNEHDKFPEVLIISHGNF